MKKIIIYIILTTVLLSGCLKDGVVIQPNTKVTPNELNENEVIGDIDDETNIEESSDVIEKDDLNKIISTLDGLKYYPEELSKRPVAVSIDNHPDARWQAGLSQAEIIYELEVEFPYTRYLCIFLAKEPKLVGPVRSARPYIIYYALENDGIFVHVGGSEDAFSEIRRLSAPDVDGLYSDAMWRYNTTGKFAPHNMYTTLKSIRDEAERVGYRAEGEFEGYKFNEKDNNLSEKYDTLNAKNVNITYNKSNTTSYTYNEENLVYLRFKDNEKHIDELNNEQLTAKNIIVIEADKSVLDNAGRLYIETIGSGRGNYITNGETVEITWVKNSEKDRTRFYINDEELSLNPGNTWIQVINSIDNITIE